MPSANREARYYEKLEGLKVRCRLCPHLCGIPDGAVGTCSVRENRGGTLYALTYGRTVTINLDPIEKKPLYHFMPGSTILSIGPNGCTLACGNCQNWHISQQKVGTEYLAPEKLVEIAGDGGSIGVAFTYTEPLLWFEYLKDVAPMLRAKGLKSVAVTNGFLNEDPAREIAPLIDAFNVDLKGIRDEFYREYCGGRVEPVKRFIEIAAAVSHVEVTNLVIPGLNDSTRDFEDLVDWLAGVSPEIPLHFSRFFPQYRMTDRPATSKESLETAYAIARKKLRYVYVGNIFIDGTEDTRCPKCGTAVVRRRGYEAEVIGTGGTCPSCGTRITGVWR
jgi:pyruvate formate lyase activating enzyme